MVEIEDWLQDPLEIGKDPYKPRKPKSLNDEQSGDWYLFHYSTRLKLNGANFFCTKVIDAARTSKDEFGWYLDAFSCELMAACDILLQELNIVYNLGLKTEKISWNNKNKNKFREKLPEKIFNHIEEGRKKDWFCEVQWYRNKTTHRYRIGVTSFMAHRSLELTVYNLLYVDKEGKLKTNEISICKDYLSNMVNYISSVWGMMAQEFD